MNALTKIEILSSELNTLTTAHQALTDRVSKLEKEPVIPILYKREVPPPTKSCHWTSEHHGTLHPGCSVMDMHIAIPLVMRFNFCPECGKRLTYTFRSDQYRDEAVQ